MKKIAIIGAGVSGLVAGIYARKAGFETEIYEQHSIAGGQCTGWTREGYHIDGCIHWLRGTKRNGGTFNSLWHDTNALNDDIEIIRHDSFGVFELDGQQINLCNSLENFREQLLTLSPNDEYEIDILCDYLKQLGNVEAPKYAVDLMNIKELFAMLKISGKSFKLMRKLKISSVEYAKKFKHPLIQAMIKSFITLSEDASISSFIVSYASFLHDNAGVPKGGSLKMAQRMKNKYLELGGKLFLNTSVHSISVDNKLAKIMLKDGTIVNADYVIPACDAHTTFKLLGGKYKDKAFDYRDRNPAQYPLFTSALYSFAVDHDMQGLPQQITFARELEIHGKKLSGLSYKCYNFEPDFAPKGKAILQVNIFCDYEFWKCLNSQQYKEVKNESAAKIIEFIESMIPELHGKIRLLDVATPLTYERYCSAYKGSWMSYAPTSQSKGLMHKGKIRGIDNLFMAGQWLLPPGGLPLAISGKWAIQRIAHKEKMDWRKI
ncbi:MAG: NAD(P)/FAD-dependent oxidoreductase [Firmicutes bacterium]|nr:NAD(P)/FAD-dependent oxidoreductase [Bacillota bacterium]